MIKRKDYLDGKYTHREYYDQFVNNEVVGRVLQHFGIDRLLASTDEHLNDIPIREWDRLAGFVWQRHGGQEIAVVKPRTNLDVLPIDYELLKAAGDGISNSTLVCIYKEAAKQIKEEYEANES